MRPVRSGHVRSSQVTVAKISLPQDAGRTDFNDILDNSSFREDLVDWSHFWPLIIFAVQYITLSHREISPVDYTSVFATLVELYLLVTIRLSCSRQYCSCFKRITTKNFPLCKLLVLCTISPQTVSPHIMFLKMEFVWCLRWPLVRYREITNPVEQFPYYGLTQCYRHF